MLRLAIAGVMSAVQGRAVVWFGLVCSSFTVINMGHSKRSFLVPMGDTSKRTVQEGNCLGARTVSFDQTRPHHPKTHSNNNPLRTCLLMLLVLAMNGVFILEQPGGSFFQHFPRFQELCRFTKVYKVAWYMFHYGARTPKRHVAFSNSKCVLRLSRGKLRGWKRAVSGQTVKHYVKKGKTKYVGTKHLKKTE